MVDFSPAKCRGIERHALRYFTGVSDEDAPLACQPDRRSHGIGREKPIRLRRTDRYVFIAVKVRLILAVSCRAKLRFLRMPTSGINPLTAMMTFRAMTSPEGVSSRQPPSLGSRAMTGVFSKASIDGGRLSESPRASFAGCCRMTLVFVHTAVV
ncbi:hypothetical protein [Rhizobium mongolense]|uniref:hypothetical protein n=1 Tax=Rhizobium mongolense TaxID=57676 RepID=UPI0034A3A960